MPKGFSACSASSAFKRPIFSTLSRLGHREGLILIYDLPSDHRHERMDRVELLDRKGHVVLVQHDEVGKLSSLKGTEPILPADVFGSPVRVHPKQILAVDRFLFSPDPSLAVFPCQQHLEVGEVAAAANSLPLTCDTPACLENGRYRKHPRVGKFVAIPGGPVRRIRFNEVCAAVPQDIQPLATLDLIRT